MLRKSLMAHAFLLALAAFCVSQSKSNEDREPVLRVDATKAASDYANFVRVTGTPEELIIDFGLNTQPMGVPKDPIAIRQQVVMNFYTAKRFQQSLQQSLDRHEAAFGEIEVDVLKRVKK